MLGEDARADGTQGVAATSGRGRTIVAALLLILLALIFWQTRVIAPSQLRRPIDRLTQDLYTIYVPLHRYAFQSEELLPLWNPHQLAGMPSLAAYNGGWLYPLNVLSIVLPVPLALGMICALSLAIAGITTRACARAIGLSQVAALLAGMLFMLDGHLVLMHLQPSFLAGTSLVPLVFLLAGRMVVDPSIRSGAFLGAAIALQILTGHAQIVLYTLYGVAVAALPPVIVGLMRGDPLGRTALRGRGSLLDAPSTSHEDAADRSAWIGPSFGLRIALAVLAGVVMTVALSAVQLLPTLELARAAVRGELNPDQIWVGPPPFGLRGAASNLGPAALFALAAPLDRRRRIVVVSAVLLIAFCWGIGLRTPFFDVFYWMPGADRFRLPSRILLIADFAIAVLATIGFDALRERASAAFDRTRARANGDHPDAASSLDLGRVITRAGCVVIALVIVQRFWFPANVLPIPQRSGDAFFAAPGFVKFLRERIGPDRALVIKNWRGGKRFPLTEKLGSLYGINIVQDFEPLAPRAYLELLSELGNWNVDAPLFWGRYQPPARSTVWHPLNMLATRFVIVDTQSTWDESLPPRFRLLYSDRQARIYENTRALPRALLVGEYQVEPSNATTLRRIQSLDFDPRRVVLLDRQVDWPGGMDSSDPDRPAPGQPAPLRSGVEWISSAPEEIVLRVTTAAQAILVLADLHWPGWSVTLDDQPRPLLRANYLFRGVAVPTGTHMVRFRYAPWSFRLGLTLTLLAVIALAVLLWRARQRNDSIDSLQARISQMSP